MAHPTLVIGNTYFVENPGAKSFVGRLVAIVDPFTVALEDASWIANTGRYHLFCRGEYDQNTEIEPAGYLPCVRYQNIVEWPYSLPTEAR